MPRNADRLALPSLAQRFEPPEGYVGQFGWLCGYSADAGFLNDAAERFTSMTTAQRAQNGRIALAVMLDPGAPPISLIDAPGVAHLPILVEPKRRPFQLLHAKVAVLGFKQLEDGAHWSLRLIVSTGNWTLQTLEESLDLSWCVDVSSGALQKPSEEARTCSADLRAAGALMTWLREIYDTRLLEMASVRGLSETRRAWEQLDEWMVICAAHAQGQARFLENRNVSLLEQLPARIRGHGNSVARRYLAMGSGFYESTDSNDPQPEVPGRIIARLQAAGLLTAKPEVDLYVNPRACQAVASAVALLAERGITVRPAGQPELLFSSRVERRLHAKFLFGANYNSNNCSSAWVYLGSGNLTGPGFVNRMSLNGGNLEAGVVFAPEGLCWKGGRGVEAAQVVTNLLPIQWDEDYKGDKEQPVAGADMEIGTTYFRAPPIAWLEWYQGEGTNELRTASTLPADLRLLDSAGRVCERTKEGFLWREPQPRQVSVTWRAGDQEIEAEIPVVDNFGRIAATKLVALDIADAWWHLAEFPQSVPEEDGDADEYDEDGSATDNPTPLGCRVPERGRVNPSSYPIREMMELVEGIAAKQCELSEADWGLWCSRLEQTLSRAKDSAVVKAFQVMNLNPLSPLRAAPFRPPYAEGTDLAPGQTYDAALTRTEKAWGVVGLPAIGTM